MAHDHFQTPPDPERGYKNQKKSKKSLKVRAKPAKVENSFGNATTIKHVEQTSIQE